MSNISAHSDGRFTITATQNRILRPNLNVRHLGQCYSPPILGHQAEITDLARIKPSLPCRAGNDVDFTDVLADLCNCDAFEEELQLLASIDRRQAEGLQAVLVQYQVHRRHTLHPVGIHGTQLRAGLHHRADLLGNLPDLALIRPHDPVGNGIRRVRTKHQLGNPHPRLPGQAIADGFTQLQLQRLTLVFAGSQHHDLGKRWVW
ncbi:hypothetical protein D3C80_1197210 [compost metagenome]